MQLTTDFRLYFYQKDIHNSLSTFSYRNKVAFSNGGHRISVVCVFRNSNLNCVVVRWKLEEQDRLVFLLAIPDFGVLLRVFFVTTTGLTSNVVRWVFCGVTEGNCKLSSFALLKFVRTCSNGKILVPDDPDTV